MPAHIADRTGTHRLPQRRAHRHPVGTRAAVPVHHLPRHLRPRSRATGDERRDARDELHSRRLPDLPHHRVGAGRLAAGPTHVKQQHKKQIMTRNPSSPEAPRVCIVTDDGQEVCGTPVVHHSITPAPLAGAPSSESALPLEPPAPTPPSSPSGPPPSLPTQSPTPLAESSTNDAPSGD